jgi:DNA-binding NarL/FixJ family response regulator
MHYAGLPGSKGADALALVGVGRALLPSHGWAYVCTALRLSPREKQILQAVFDDQKEDAIAHELGISPHTVNTYFQRMYAKLHVSSRPQLILRVMAEYLIFASDQSAVLVSCPKTTNQDLT